ncbi:MAG: FAD-linked oxidase C-terminal domain-containing protein, partial [Pseudomonadota bacterium]
TRASGTTAVRYGTMRENVMALEVVLADGRVVRTGTRARKSASGYDLTKLMVGSEGTLGIITELTVRLQGVPEAISAATCAFPDIASAVNSVIATIQMGVPMARMEFVDDVSAAAMNSYFGTDHPVLPHLFMEFHGTEAAVAEQAEMVGEIAAEHGGQGFLWSSKAEERNLLWHMRHKAYYAQKSLKPGCFAVTTDICVPISELAYAVTATRADIDEMGLVGPMLGHVGEGNYHSALLVDRDDEDAMARAKEVAHRMAERALSVGGTVTGEHGVGMGKMRYMAAEHGDGWAVMAGLKRSLDPQNILNPGKVVEVN